MFNIFKKKKPVNKNTVSDNNKPVAVPATPLESNNDEKSSVKDKVMGVGMNMMQKVAMKKLAKMSPQEQAKMMQDMLKPENKGQLLSAMEMMRKSGQITEQQYQEAKKRLGVL
jgi:hypothetical protein